MRALDFTPDQLRRLWEFVRLVAPQAEEVRYALLGMEELGDREASLRLVRELQTGDWDSAARHAALAGRNTLLTAVLLDVEPLGTAYWVLLRSPHDPWEDASVESYGRIPDVDRLPLKLRWDALASASGKVRT